MTTRLRHVVGLFVIMGIGQVAILPLAAQTPPSLTSATPTVVTNFPPMPPSPVQAFRNLMQQSSDKRDEELASRSPEIRQRILAKIQEYQAMPAADREARLRTTQLRWYLLLFINKTPAERAAQISQVPEADRQALIDRLQKWDRLSPEEQNQVLKYEKTMEQFAGQHLEGVTATNRVLASVSPQARPDALKSLDNFLKLPPEQREQIYSSFQRFFTLTGEDRQRTLDALSDAERAQVEIALQRFSILPDTQRAECLKAFSRFSQMKDGERDEFMKNAERWSALPAGQRQAWRDLVSHLTPMPPLPPGLGFPPMPPAPPMPLQVNLQPPVPH